MIGLFLKLAFSRALKALGDVCEVAWRYPMQCALAVLILALGAQTVRLHHAKMQILTERGEYVQAQAKAEAKAIAGKYRIEALYRAKAKDTDHAYQVALVDARSAADRYITTHRVHATTQGATSGTTTTAKNGGAGSAERSSEDAELVTVSADDVQICTVNSQRLLAGHDWAVGLNEIK